MTQENTSSWLAAHLYYNEPWERLLTEAVLPYAEIVKSTGIANSYFFIRYWERGPHIRLRFKAAPEIIEKILRPNLEEHFLNYFDSVPSLRTDPPYPPRIPESYKWLPNNTVQYEAYFAELDRYGGELGVMLAEAQFALSSEVVLKEMEIKGQQWSYDDALGTAIKLHLSFLHAAGLNKQETTDFLGFFFKNWLPHALSLNPTSLGAVEYNQKKEDILKRFEDAFDIQKESLLPFHQTLWDGLKGKVENFQDELLIKWVQENKSIIEALQEASDNNKLTQRKEEHAYQYTKQYPGYHSLWDHYADYIHLSNNRLGIHNKDEGYLAYLMMRSMEATEASDEEAGIASLTDGQKHFFIYLE